MKFNFRKITSVLASAVMLGSTVGFAAAASYPAPFVQGGSADVAVVVGSSAANADYLAALDLGVNLQTELARATATPGSTTGATGTGGDSVNLASSTKLYWNSSIGGSTAPRQILTKSELPNLLADGTFYDANGIAYTYSQTITLGDTPITFDTASGYIKDPTLELNIGTSSNDPAFTYNLNLNKALNVSDSTTVQGRVIKLLGNDYTIGASSTNSTIYLYNSGNTVSIKEGDSTTVTVGGVEHTISNDGVSSTTQLTVTVDGDQRSVNKGSSYTFGGNLTAYVKEVTYLSKTGSVSSAQLSFGSNSVQLVDKQTVKTGSASDSITGTHSNITASSVGTITAISVSMAKQKSNSAFLQADGSFTDPVFGAINLKFAGANPAFDSTSRDNVVVDTDNNNFARVTFTSAIAGATGETTLNYAYDNDTTNSGTLPILAYQIPAGNMGNIHVLEGEAGLTSDWFVVNSGDFGRILRLDEITYTGAGSSDYLVFKDAITGDSSGKITISNAGTGTLTGFDGQTYYVNVTGTSNPQVKLYWGASAAFGTAGDATTIFPRIKLKSGEFLTFLKQTTLVNGTSYIFPDGRVSLGTTGTLINLDAAVAATTTTANGITWRTTTGVLASVVAGDGAFCNFNKTASMGPAVLVIEEKKYTDSAQGDSICIPLTTTGTNPKIAINTPQFTGGNSNFQSLTSNSYKSQAVDAYGNWVEYDTSTGTNNKATIKYPDNQMYIDVLFAAPGVTVVGGSSSGGSVVELGSVTVKDSEVSSVSSKNLIVLGGSCVNTVAAELLGSKGTPLCGTDFTAKTGVGADQFLVQSFENPYTSGKIAMLVAGYEASDTAKAATFLRTEKPITDKGTVIKKVTQTLADVK